MNVKTILIQTVGTGGQDYPAWEALAWTVRHVRPDLLVQWCSHKTLKETIPRFEEALGRPDWPMQIRRPDPCPDPNNVQQLAERYLQSIDELRRQFPEATLKVDFTSGTKPMSAAAVAAAVARRVCGLLYATGPRDDSGRVFHTEQVTELACKAIVVDRELRELGLLFNQGRYAAVANQALTLAKELAENEPMRARALSLALLAQMYEAWDRFNWKQAVKRDIKACRKQEKEHRLFSSCGWDFPRIENQGSFLETCHKQPLSAQRLVDLLANAERCLKRGRYDDALARLYRLVEYLGQVRFASTFDIDGQCDNPTRKVSLDSLARRAPKLAERLKNCAAIDQDGHVKLALAMTLEALNEADDPLGRRMWQDYGWQADKKKGPLGSLLQQRNESLLAHGTHPIKKDKAEQLFDLVGQYVKQHIDGQADRQGTGEQLQEPAPDFDTLKALATFPTCPWVEVNRAEQG